MTFKIDYDKNSISVKVEKFSVVGGKNSWYEMAYYELDQNKGYVTMLNDEKEFKRLASWKKAVETRFNDSKSINWH